MKILVIGSGLMGRAIAHDLCKHSNFDNMTIADKDDETLRSAKKFLEGEKINFLIMNVEKIDAVKNLFESHDVVISAIPYRFNYELAKMAVEAKTHFLDLGGNNGIVEKERNLFEQARKQEVTIIPDCGLAPGLVSTITRDIVERMDSVNYVKLRVGGLPVDPKPPLNYQIVFSPNGLINEYMEDAIVLDHGQIIEKKSMADIETIQFSEPFKEMEAFLTSGGCSTLPYTYKDKIDYLDYKTIRYPGHCEKFKILLYIGLGGEKIIRIGEQEVVPRKILIDLLMKNLPATGQDVVLLKVLSEGLKDGKKVC
ncbi:MAG: saccharopine dehydrogenase NADP-binding domain-containing protein, partial [Candidatus Thermoplasmatota archaeon]|nr:saccharopine dehydrogenase NADP-binding domain-containing protein [Candidatus Thermoplasmatota archaeon]